MQAEAAVFRDFSRTSDSAAAAAVNADRLHVLVDLNGHTDSARSAILAAQPAPIQVNYLGYIASTQSTYIQYVVTDAVVTPPEAAQGFTERFALQPACFFVTDFMQSHSDMLVRPRASPPEQAAGFSLVETEGQIPRALRGHGRRPPVLLSNFNQLYVRSLFALNCVSPAFWKKNKTNTN